MGVAGEAEGCGSWSENQARPWRKKWVSVGAEISQEAAALQLTEMVNVLLTVANRF